ncbi:MAG: hypothetical protein E7423_08710 [Ruminococcaceae bacterium]|jgi:cell wall-associated NlpC family hydrolase|nr:hypothetical protein [Oscillospiraceae bacterium]
MAFFKRIRKTLLITFILSSCIAFNAYAYDDVKGGEIQVDSAVNLRAEATTDSTVLDRLYNGERVAVIGEEEDWYQVVYNGQTGYVSAGYVELSDIMNVEPGAAQVTTDVLNVRSIPSTNGDVVTRLYSGANVKIIGINNGWFKVEGSDFTGYISAEFAEIVKNTISSTAASSGVYVGQTASSSTRQQIVDYAASFLGCPYVYGGTSPKGFDCSGFTRYVYAHFNISLPHSSASQYKSSVTKIKRSELKLGDLVFFSSGGSGVGHVGIYVGGGNFIHAPRPGKSVTYDSLDSNYYSSHYIGAGTLLR